MKKQRLCIALKQRKDVFFMKVNDRQLIIDGSDVAAWYIGDDL